MKRNNSCLFTLSMTSFLWYGFYLSVIWSFQSSTTTIVKALTLKQNQKHYKQHNQQEQPQSQRSLQYTLTSQKLNPTTMETVGTRRRTTTTKTTTTRRDWMGQSFKDVITASSAAAIVMTTNNKPVLAAPPIAVIAEELGYFPVTNKNGNLVYVPKITQRHSTDQAIELAKFMNSKGINMYGAYWCPHCARQKELFGKEAWTYLTYVECSSKGYNYKGLCPSKVDGYPTFLNSKGTFTSSGEQSLESLAKQVNFPQTFDPKLEGDVPMIGTACKLPKN